MFLISASFQTFSMLETGECTTMEHVTDASVDCWISALDIAVQKPHSVDKRLAGATNIASWRGDTGGGVELVTDEMLQDIKSKLANGTLEDSLGEGKGGIVFMVQRVIGRNERTATYHQLVAVRDGRQAEWWPLDADSDSVGWGVVLEEGGKVVGRLGKGVGEQQAAWVRDRLLPRLIGWAEQGAVGKAGAGSLHLVGVEEYTAEYCRMKSKYAKQIIDNWEESSDPEKFVHEDLGIASYLLLIWRRQRRRSNSSALQTFVDLGCGNGLLVYLLTMEGHSGVGYDLRSRKIWSWFRKCGVQLREEVISPSLSTTFNTDWILGNHSDELTPWVPVIAALSGPQTSYWVLPCCPHSFEAKYQRRDANKSVWRDYLDWLADLGKEAGFEVEEDRMRIPSTKRVCQVGQVMGEIIPDRRDKVEALVARRAANFVAREKVERVRNCSKVDRQLVAEIVGKVAELCLAEKLVTVVGGKSWNKGSSIPLGQLVAALGEAGLSLQKLKSECGGLQTLLKNHHHVFVVRGGFVRVRVPGEEISNSKKRPGKGAGREKRAKTKPCWHYFYHPDGCPLSPEICTWLHEENDTLSLRGLDTEC